MGFDRTTPLYGPAKVAFGGADFFSATGIRVVPVIEKAERGNDAFGTLARKVIDKMVEVRFTPTEWGDLSVLFPHLDKVPGDLLMDDTDNTAVITPRNGDPLTLASCVITQMPNITLDAGSNPFGECVIMGIVADQDDTEVLADYLSFAGAATGANLTGVDKTKLLNAQYKATYNSGTYYAQRGGFAINFPMTATPVQVDGWGTINYILGSLGAEVRFRPMGVTESAYMTLLGMSTGVGASLTDYDMTIEGLNPGDPSVVIQDMEVDPGEYIYQSTENRNGELVFRSNRDEASGDIVTLATVGVVPTP